MIYDAATGALVRSLPGHPDWTHAVAFSPDGSQLLSGGAYDYQVKLWSVADGALLATYDREAGWGQLPILPVAFSPTGQQFAYGRNDGPVVLANNAFVTVAPVPRDTDAPGDAHARRTLAVQRLGRASFALTIPSGTGTALDVFDIRGALVAHLWRGRSDASAQRVVWLSQGASGVYLARLTDGGRLLATARIVVTR